MLKKLIRYFKKKYLKNSLIQNINFDLTKNQNRVLISYINDNFFTDFDNQNIYHTNIREINQIIKVFISLGFTIDIVNALDEKSIKKLKRKKYDILFGFGTVFYEMSKFNSKAERIIYVTEHHPRYSSKEEKKRIEYFKQRNNRKVKLSRSGVYYKEKHFENVDSAIILGDIFPYKKYEFDKYRISPTGLKNINFKFDNKNHDVTKKNFLWFGSKGAIHKGLDLLLDIFKRNEELNLYICGLTKKDKFKLRFKEKNNIHDLGRINVNSDKFINIIKKCSYIILPSCSEAISTSVLTGMRHGLIPVVIKNTGFNKLKSKAYLLDDFKLSYLENEIIKLSEQKSDILSKQSKEIYDYANKEFNINKYTNDFKNIIKKIINR
jgi:hypothetical protein